ncbi:hypothetical protein P3X46_030472 [Hevea brasiliensis]|uniref:Aspartic peptidase DDI1-type domain-containing protein n=1 Tax=Hevea brasiliensis TaxID=3981 RepID=A0ABQ9KK80_HEVBR|nr:hypothetical protein P3X46_030472 [Hevea brasiliensis]
MPSYAKFLKEILSNKKKLEEFETVALTEESSAILQNKLPPKLKDPGSFSIPCHIGDISIDKALCDLGASVSLMPLSIYEKMKIGEMKPTTISLQLADRSIKFPIGVVENVPLKVGKIFIPVDFVVLEMEEDKVEFNLFQAMKKKDDSNSCLRVDVIDEEVREVLKKQHPKDPLEACLVHNIKKGDEIEETAEYATILEGNPPLPMADIEKIGNLKQETTSSSKFEKGEAPKVELKPLPTNLRYAFLGQNSTYLVIVSAKLTDCEVEKLLRVLRKHRRIIGYTIDDIKGIHPFCACIEFCWKMTIKPLENHKGD